MSDYIPNARYVEAMSGLLVQMFVHTTGHDDLVLEAAGQVIDTGVLLGIDEQEAARMINRQVNRRRKESSDEEKDAWIIECVEALPSHLREKTFALFAMRVTYTTDGKPDRRNSERLEAAAEMLDISPEQSAKIIEVGNILGRRIL